MKDLSRKTHRSLGSVRFHHGFIPEPCVCAFADLCVFARNGSALYGTSNFLVTPTSAQPISILDLSRNGPAGIALTAEHLIEGGVSELFQQSER